MSRDFNRISKLLRGLKAFQKFCKDFKGFSRILMDFKIFKGVLKPKKPYAINGRSLKFLGSFKKHDKLSFEIL